MLLVQLAPTGTHMSMLRRRDASCDAWCAQPASTAQPCLCCLACSRKAPRACSSCASAHTLDHDVSAKSSKRADRYVSARAMRMRLQCKIAEKGQVAAKMCPMGVSPQMYSLHTVEARNFHGEQRKCNAEQGRSGRCRDTLSCSQHSSTHFQRQPSVRCSHSPSARRCSPCSQCSRADSCLTRAATRRARRSCQAAKHARVVRTAAARCAVPSRSRSMLRRSAAASHARSTVASLRCCQGK